MFKSVSKFTLTTIFCLISIFININNSFGVSNELEVTWNQKYTGARISYWDLENNKKIASIDIVDTEFENIKGFRKLSDYTKPEIKILNGLFDEVINKNLEEKYLAEDSVCKYKVDLPTLFKTKEYAKEYIETDIHNWFSNTVYVKTFFDILQLNKKTRVKWNEGNLCILLEPMMIIHTSENEDWLLTCSEIGLLALNNYAETGKLVDAESLKDSAYRALPFGTYKTNSGILSTIANYNGDSETPIYTEDGYKNMVNSLGCIELTVNSSTQIEVPVYDDEETTEEESKATVAEITETETIKETEETKIIETEKQTEEIKETTKNMLATNLDREEKIKKIKEVVIYIFNNFKYSIIGLFVLLCILIVGFSLNKRPKKVQNKLCENTYCNFYNQGMCTSDAINKWNKVCNKENNYAYFEEKF